MSLLFVWVNYIDIGYFGNFEGGKYFSILLNVMVKKKFKMNVNIKNYFLNFGWLVIII